MNFESSVLNNKNPINERITLTAKIELTIETKILKINKNKVIPIDAKKFLNKNLNPKPKALKGFFVL